MKLRTFKISFKLYYHELCDWSSDYIRAKNRREALRKFAKRHRIQDADIRQPESWRWWEGDWYNAFHLIEEAARKPLPCARCHGTGTVVLE